MARHLPTQERGGVLFPVLALVVLVLVGLGIVVNVLFERSIRQPIPGAYVQAPPSPAASGANVKVAQTAAAGAGAASAPARPAASAGQGFQPPGEDTIPDNDYGKMIRLGEQVFNNTGQVASKYVGNDLNCVNCHLDAARKPDSAPLWAAFIHYPAYRSKTGKVDTLASRLQGCFQFSMNGKAPPAGDPDLVALETYAAFLARGAPMGAKLPGQGYPKLAPPAQPPDYARGRTVYEVRCAFCHGADGAGQKAGTATVFPPLWGPRSYNWGAGMSNVDNAAAFIKANMPYSQGGSLTDQQAWDVAAYIDGKPRPQDPRFKGSVAATRATFHDTPQSLYGRTVDGVLLGGDGPPGAQANR